MTDKPRRKRERRSKRSTTSTSNDPKLEFDTLTTSVPKNTSRSKIYDKKRIEMPSRLIGLLIGPTGINISRLRERTHCDVIVLRNKDEKENNKENDKVNNTAEVELRGSPEEIDLAYKEIQFLMTYNRFMVEQERQQYNITNKSTTKRKYYEEETFEVMRVPAKMCGMLIGNKGERINELQLETNTEIFVKFDDSSDIESGISEVTIKGLKLNIQIAKKQIRHIMKMFGGVGGVGAKELCIEIPSKYSKLLIGENGKTIKDLQKEYGCTIRIKKDKRRDREFDYTTKDNEQIKHQRTDIVAIIGETHDRMLCKMAIDQVLGGVFIQCNTCQRLTLETEGYADKNNKYDQNWYCNECWENYKNKLKEQQEELEKIKKQEQEYNKTAGAQSSRMTSYYNRQETSYYDTNRYNNNNNNNYNNNYNNSNNNNYNNNNYNNNYNNNNNNNNRNMNQVNRGMQNMNVNTNNRFNRNQNQNQNYNNQNKNQNYNQNRNQNYNQNRNQNYNQNRNQNQRFNQNQNYNQQNKNYNQNQNQRYNQNQNQRYNQNQNQNQKQSYGGRYNRNYSQN